MEEVDTLVEFASREKNIPGLEGSFWRFEGISVVDDPALRKKLRDESRNRIEASARSQGLSSRRSRALPVATAPV